MNEWNIITGIPEYDEFLWFARVVQAHARPRTSEGPRVHVRGYCEFLKSQFQLENKTGIDYDKFKALWNKAPQGKKVYLKLNDFIRLCSYSTQPNLRPLRKCGFKVRVIDEYVEFDKRTLKNPTVL